MSAIFKMEVNSISEIRPRHNVHGVVLDVKGMASEDELVLATWEAVGTEHMIFTLLRESSSMKEEIEKALKEFKG